MINENMSEGEKALKEVPEIVKLVNDGNLNAVKEVILSGKSKVSDIDDTGMTPLQHAAYRGRLDLCKFLLDSGAEVNSTSHEHGYSVLHFAALSGNQNLVKYLLNAGAKSYYTNSLNRTPAQMAGFVGNRAIVAIINNYLPLSDIEYYSKPQGLEAAAKLPQQVVKPLHTLTMVTNLHPVSIALMVQRTDALMQNISQASKILSLMCEKEAKRNENVNEIICLKLHFLSYILNTLQKELLKHYNEPKIAKPDNNNQNANVDQNSKTKKNEEKLIFESVIKKWLTGRPSDGYEERLEFYVQDAIKCFPYPEMPLFLQIVRSVTSKPGEITGVLDVLQSVIYGQGLPEDDVLCSCCSSRNSDAKKCSKCKSVQYCDKICQRLHWVNHKKFCSDLARKMEDMNISQDVQK